MDVKICDRCERIVGDEGGINIGIKIITEEFFGIYDNINLCNDCKCQLYEFLKSGKEDKDDN